MAKLEGLASKVGLTELDATKALAGYPKATVKCSHTTARDFELAADQGINNETVVLDMSALRTLSHIAELLRNGACLAKAKAKELARHTDITMTMRYTQISIEVQYKPVQGIPCQWIGSDSDVSASAAESLRA